MACYVPFLVTVRKKINFSILRTKVAYKASHYHADMAEGQCTLRMVA
jgi:hypothetical protein